MQDFVSRGCFIGVVAHLSLPEQSCVRPNETCAVTRSLFDVSAAPSFFWAMQEKVTETSTCGFRVGSLVSFFLLLFAVLLAQQALHFYFESQTKKCADREVANFVNQHNKNNN